MHQTTVTTQGTPHRAGWIAAPQAVFCHAAADCGAVEPGRPAVQGQLDPHLIGSPGSREASDLRCSRSRPSSLSQRVIVAPCQMHAQHSNSSSSKSRALHQLGLETQKACAGAGVDNAAAAHALSRSAAGTLIQQNSQHSWIKGNGPGCNRQTGW